MKASNGNIPVKVILIDNKDSFTYNLAQIIEESGLCELQVIPYEEIARANIQCFDKIMISPGPGLPVEYPLLFEILEKYYKYKPILGVCLGHQIIGIQWGMELTNLKKIYHGEASEIKQLKQNELFHKVPREFQAARYHSWVLQNHENVSDIEILAIDEQDHIMALKHKNYPVYGVQFHPESIITPFGKKIIHNWLLTESN